MWILCSVLCTEYMTSYYATLTCQTAGLSFICCVHARYLQYEAHMIYTLEAILLLLLSLHIVSGVLFFLNKDPSYNSPASSSNFPRNMAMTSRSHLYSFLP